MVNVSSDRSRGEFMKYHYTYMLHGDISYIGVRSSKCLPENDIKYWGSSKHTPKNISETHTKLILAEFPTREEAMEHEIGLHEFYDVGRSPKFYNQAKSTSTGFNMLGVPRTPRDEKIYHFIHIDDTEFTGTTSQLSESYDIPLCDLTKLISERYNSVKNWRLFTTDIRSTGNNRKGEFAARYDTTLHHFIHVNGTEFIGTQYDFRMKYNLNCTGVHSVITGKEKSTKQWRLITTDIRKTGHSRKGVFANHYDDTKYNFHHDLHGPEYCTKWELRQKYGLNHSICDIINGNRKQRWGWRLSSTIIEPLCYKGENNSSYDHTIYNFIHDTHGQENCTQYDLVHKYNICRSGVSRLVNKKQPISNGWRIK